MSDKALTLLKQIYAHSRDGRRLGREALVDEDPNEALEYLLQEIVDRLSDRQPHRGSAPLYVVMESAVSSLHLDRQERQKAEIS